MPPIDPAAVRRWQLRAWPRRFDTAGRRLLIASPAALAGARGRQHLHPEARSIGGFRNAVRAARRP